MGKGSKRAARRGAPAAASGAPAAAGEASYSDLASAEMGHAVSQLKLQEAEGPCRNCLADSWEEDASDLTPLVHPGHDSEYATVQDLQAAFPNAEIHSSVSAPIFSSTCWRPSDDPGIFPMPPDAAAMLLSRHSARRYDELARVANNAYFAKVLSQTGTLLHWGGQLVLKCGTNGIAAGATFYASRGYNYWCRAGCPFEKRHEDGCADCKAPTTLFCGACRVAMYCSKACLERDRPQHKNDCKRFRKMREGASNTPE